MQRAQQTATLLVTYTAAYTSPQNFHTPLPIIGQIKPNERKKKRTRKHSGDF